MLISILTLNVAAQSGWEAISGFNITNVTLDTYNETIDNFNDAVPSLNLSGPELLQKYESSDVTLTTEEQQEIGTILATTDVTNKEDYENIDRVPLVYLGAKRAISDKTDLNIRYEYIFGEVEQSYTANNVKYDNSIAVDLHGLTFLLDHEINERWYRCLSRKLSHLVKNFFEYHSCRSSFKSSAA